MFDLLKKNHGLLLIVASQLFLSVVNIAVKKLNSIDPPVPTLELIIIRMGMTFAFSIAYMLYTNVPHPFLGPEGVRVLLAFRGFAGFFGLFGVYFALQYLSLSDATVLTFLVPLTTALSGAIFLKENFTKKQFVAGTLSLIGVIFIARPVSLFGHASAAEIPHVPSVSTNSTAAVPLPENASEQGTPGDRLIAVGVSLVGVLGSTGAYTAIRAIGKRAHALHSMASFSLQSVIVSVIGMIITRTSPVLPTRLLWLALFIEIGVFGFLAQVLLTMGFQRETAGRGTMAVYTQIVFASIGERIFFHVVPSVLSIIGTLIIISCALYIALTKEREEESETKSNLVSTGVRPPISVALEDLDSSQDAMEEGLLTNYDGREQVSRHHPPADKGSRSGNNELELKNGNAIPMEVPAELGSIELKEKSRFSLLGDNDSDDEDDGDGDQVSRVAVDEKDLLDGPHVHSTSSSSLSSSTVT